MPGDAFPTTDDLDVGQTIAIPRFSQGQKLFGRYMLKKIIGRGGMGVVWLAEDEKLRKKPVALKLLPETLCYDDDAIDRLMDETEAGRRLAHPNIVHIFTFERDDSGAAISMEYVDGGTLSNLRSKRPNKVFEPRDLVLHIDALCAALDYAHTQERIVHRDLKPRNLMVNSSGRLKITDFGISCSIREDVTKHTRTQFPQVGQSAGHTGSSGSGSPPYISPQQWDGKRATPLDDIYSIGATLFELLAGSPPFRGVVDSHRVRNEVPPPIAHRRQEDDITGPIPAHWEETIAACLAKDPKQRPQTVLDLRKRLLEGGPLNAEAVADLFEADAVDAGATLTDLPLFQVEVPRAAADLSVVTEAPEEFEDKLDAGQTVILPRLPERLESAPTALVETNDTAAQLVSEGPAPAAQPPAESAEGAASHPSPGPRLTGNRGLAEELALDQSQTAGLEPPPFDRNPATEPADVGSEPVFKEPDYFTDEPGAHSDGPLVTNSAMADPPVAAEALAESEAANAPAVAEALVEFEDELDTGATIFLTRPPAHLESAPTETNDANQPIDAAAELPGEVATPTVQQPAQSAEDAESAHDAALLLPESYLTRNRGLAGELTLDQSQTAGLEPPPIDQNSAPQTGSFESEHISEEPDYFTNLPGVDSGGQTLTNPAEAEQPVVPEALVEPEVAEVPALAEALEEFDDDLDTGATIFFPPPSKRSESAPADANDDNAKLTSEVLSPTAQPPSESAEETATNRSPESCLTGNRGLAEELALNQSQAAGLDAPPFDRNPVLPPAPVESAPIFEEPNFFTDGSEGDSVGPDFRNPTVADPPRGPAVAEAFEELEDDFDTGATIFFQRPIERLESAPTASVDSNETNDAKGGATDLPGEVPAPTTPPLPESVEEAAARPLPKSYLTGDRGLAEELTLDQSQATGLEPPPFDRNSAPQTGFFESEPIFEIPDHIADEPERESAGPALANHAAADAPVTPGIAAEPEVPDFPVMPEAIGEPPTLDVAVVPEEFENEIDAGVPIVVPPPTESPDSTPAAQVESNHANGTAAELRSNVTAPIAQQPAQSAGEAVAHPSPESHLTEIRGLLEEVAKHRTDTARLKRTPPDQISVSESPPVESEPLSEETEHLTDEPEVNSADPALAKPSGAVPHWLPDSPLSTALVTDRSSPAVGSPLTPSPLPTPNVTSHRVSRPRRAIPAWIWWVSGGFALLASGYIAVQVEWSDNLPPVGEGPIIGNIGTLTFQIEPSDAKVLLDDKVAPSSPGTFTNVPFGGHWITATLDKYEKLEQHVVFTRTSIDPFQFKLNPITGTLTVDTVPPGATIHLEGCPPQSSPATFTGLPFKIYKITATLDGYRTKLEEINFNRNTVKLPPLVFEPTPETMRLIDLVSDIEKQAEGSKTPKYLMACVEYLLHVERFSPSRDWPPEKVQQILVDAFDALRKDWAPLKLSEHRSRLRDYATPASAAARLDILPAILIMADLAVADGSDDLVKAFNWFYYAADNRRCPEAMRQLGYLYFKGAQRKDSDTWLITRNPVEATRWFEQAANLGDTAGSALLCLAIIQDAVKTPGADGVVGKVAEAVKTLQQLAMDEKAGPAHWILGTAYWQGWGGLGNVAKPDRYRTAEEWLKKAINNREWSACGTLGKLYETGATQTGVEPFQKSIERAEELYKQGEENENQFCGYLLGDLMYTTGKASGDSKRMRRGLELIERAKTSGIEQANEWLKGRRNEVNKLQMKSEP